MKTQIDHLVIVAKTLKLGQEWCEATVGISPGPGGEHVQFGTHNRLFRIATPVHPLAYLDIIAINPGAPRSANAVPKRWFDMDDAALQAAVDVAPQLVNFVVTSSDINAARACLTALGQDCGPAVRANRHTRRRLLQWRITVRDDGHRLFNGALPTLIQWGEPLSAEPFRRHPSNSLPRSGVTLQGISVTHPDAVTLRAAYDSIGLTEIPVAQGPANLSATLDTPRGVVVLQSLGV